MASLYKAWIAMKQRCENSNHTNYHRYGGRGIRVCQRWRESFDNFLQDMGPRPSPEHTLDRINNDGNYSPENCRWATRAEQYANRPTYQLERDFCPKGHPYQGDNLYYVKGRGGRLARRCRTCSRQQTQEYKARKHVS